jgi:NitT/TauT family transport system ATP-binding protein
VPTTYPKCSPSELMGLLVLLNEHKGEEDLARLADDLDLEIDEILPSSDFAETLGLVDVTDGRARLTDSGRRMLSSSIRERKSVLREQMRRTALFRTLLRLLESAPEHRVDEDQVLSVLDLTPAPTDEVVQNIVNWGRYAELLRYDADNRVFSLPSRVRVRTASGVQGRPPSGGASRAAGAHRAGPTDEAGDVRVRREAAAPAIDAVV